VGLAFIVDHSGRVFTKQTPTLRDVACNSEEPQDGSGDIDTLSELSTATPSNLSRADAKLEKTKPSATSGVLNSLAAEEAPAPFATSRQYVTKRKAAIQEGHRENGEDNEDEDGMSDETLELPGAKRNTSNNSKKRNKKKDSSKKKKKNNKKKKKSKNSMSDDSEMKNSRSDEALVPRSDEALLQRKPEVKNARPDEALVQSKPEVKTARSLKKARSDEAPVQSKPKVKRSRSKALVQTDPDEEPQTSDETEAPKKKKKPNVFGKYKAANRYWLKCPERIELLADMPLPELK
ncbi:unnamed protein product, partial [Symbiodinium sp. CCMP2456]